MSMSDRVSSCSRSSAPSASLKRRTQPTLSTGRPRSISLVATAGMPAVVTVEVAQHRPHCLDGVLQNGALDDLDHGRRQRVKWRFRASKPPWKTPAPMPDTSSSATASSHSNSAVHSPNVRSPSVIGRQAQRGDVVGERHRALQVSRRCRTCRSRTARGASRGCDPRSAAGKSRMQPILSEGSPSSMRLSRMRGCQRGRALKSLIRAPDLGRGRRGRR